MSGRGANSGEYLPKIFGSSFSDLESVEGRLDDPETVGTDFVGPMRTIGERLLELLEI